MFPIIISIFLVENYSHPPAPIYSIFHSRFWEIIVFFFFSAGEHFTRKVSTRKGKQRLTHWWIVMDLAHKQNSWEQLSESYLLGFRGVQLPLEFRENHVVPRFFESGSLVRNIARTGVKTCRVVSWRRKVKEKKKKKKKRKERSMEQCNTAHVFNLTSKRKKSTYISSSFFFVFFFLLIGKNF